MPEESGYMSEECGYMLEECGYMQRSMVILDKDFNGDNNLLHFWRKVERRTC